MRLCVRGVTLCVALGVLLPLGSGLLMLLLMLMLMLKLLLMLKLMLMLMRPRCVLRLCLCLLCAPFSVQRHQSGPLLLTGGLLCVVRPLHFFQRR